VIDFIWNDLLLNPMINGLIILSRLLFDNFGLAIIVFTVLVRLATLPLNLRQLHSSRRMQTLQPKLQEIQKKYKDPKRRSEETMKLYKAEGVNPIGCLGPMLIQFPIWIALYQVLAHTVAGTPERVVDLSQRLYPWSFIQTAVPLPTQFLGLDLGRPATIMVVFVFITTWLQTKLSLTNTSMGSAQQQQTNQMMLWMMPFLFAWFTISVPSGLALYWTVTNTIGIVMNYFVYGWKDRPWTDIFLNPKPEDPRGGKRPRPVTPRAPSPSGGTAAALTDGKSQRTTPAPDAGADERQSDAQSGNKRKERRGGGEQGAPAARSRPVSGRRRGR
jgi:YidC/Oxa1 family membrane protein insertase